MKHLKSLSRFPVAIGILAASAGLSGCQPAPNSPEVLLERSRINREREEYEDALDALTKAIQSEPMNAELYYERALVHERAEDLNAALEDYDQAIRIDHDWREALNNRAVVLARMQRFPEAVEGFSQVLEVAPEDTLAMRNRGLAKHDSGDSEAALDDVDAALRIDPGDAETWLIRGNICMAADMLEDAVASYSEALKLDQQYLPAREQRVIALEKLGRLRQSRNDQARVESIIQLEAENAALNAEFNAEERPNEQTEG